jgi:hypothetical protein
VKWGTANAGKRPATVTGEPILVDRESLKKSVLKIKFLWPISLTKAFMFV